jgi:SAM-dependent methyltransferase
MQVDFGHTAEDYGRFRAGFPDAFFERAAAHGVGGTGQRILDLGTGTGALARGLASRGAEVVGLDPAPEMIEQARTLDRKAGVSIAYIQGYAEATALPGAEFDAVTAGQCWHWFDRPAAAREARRLLKPGGVLMIAHYDWLPLPGNVVEATETLIRKHNPEWAFSGGNGVYPQWLNDLALSDFDAVESFTFDQPQPYSHEAWRGRIRASAGVGASLPPPAVERFDAELARLLARRFPEDPLAVAHRVFAAFGRKPRAAPA